MPERSRRRLGTAAIAVLALTLFVALAGYVSTGGTDAFDNAVRTTVHQSASPFLTNVALGFTILGSLTVLIPLSIASALWFLIKNSRGAVIMLVSVMGGALLINSLLKLAFHRPRPAPFFGTDPETFSFPSGHAFFAACFFGTIFFVITPNSRFRTLFWCLAIAVMFFIGWSRIYLGVHYPTDVGAGLLMAISWIACLSSIFPSKWVRSE